MCFGLNRDTELKNGQIAHLDHNSTNNSEDNLAFLCLDHHDAYDSRSSQSKGFTLGEVKQFRKELYEALDKSFETEVHFGTMTLPEADPYAGQYIRLDYLNDSADITVTPLPDGSSRNAKYAVSGLAFHGTDREAGPNIGELNFVGELIGRTISFHERMPNSEETHTVLVEFTGDGLTIEEKNEFGVYGVGVSFRGKYRRV